MNARLTTFWRGVKTFFVWLSALLCLAVAVWWCIALAGFYFAVPSPQMGNFGFAMASLRGGLLMEAMEINKFEKEGGVWGEQPPELGTMEDPDYFMPRMQPVFIIPSFELLEIPTPSYVHLLILPYWLLILVFAAAPALSMRRHYREKREKKFFEQIVAQKKAEGKLHRRDAEDTEKKTF